MGQIKGLLCDMDGTLIDSEAAFRKQLHLLLEAEGFRVTERFWQAMIGADAEQTEKLICSHAPQGFDFELFRAKLLALFEQDPLTHKDLLFPDAEGFLKQAQQRGYRLALVTSSDRERTERVLAECELNRYFETVVTASDVVHRKPAPDLYLLACAKLDLPPSACLAIEDSGRGIEAAKAAGLAVVARRHPELKIDQSGAALQVDTLTALWQTPFFQDKIAD